MALPGVLTFFGLALVTMDVLGGILAAGFLARGRQGSHLLAFVGGYALVVTAATLVLHPLLHLVGVLLDPLLASDDALSVVEIVVGLALIGVGLHQRRMAGREPVRADKQVADRFGALLVGGMAFALTALADPSFTIAVGMASAEQHLVLRILLLVGWNLIYQAPLVTVTVAAQVGAHERILAAVSSFFAPRRRVLLRVFAVVLCVVGIVVTADGILGLASTHHPWLRDLLAWW